MIVVYEKETNKIVGMALRVFDNGKMRDYKMEELYPNIDHEKHGFLILEDSIEQVKLGTKQSLKFDKKGKPTGLEAPSTLRIALSTTALDQDGDGLPEIAATARGLYAATFGSESETEVIVQIMDGDKEASVAMDVKLSTTGGTLESRLLTTDKKGTARTKLFAGQATITVTVIATAENFDPVSLTLEVMPIDDLKNVAKRKLKG